MSQARLTEPGAPPRGVARKCRALPSARPILIVCGGALALRLLFVLLYPQQPIDNDALGYDQEAVQLAFGVPQGQEPVGISKGPVYPLWLAGLYRLTGHDPRAARVMQAFLGAGTVVLLWALAARVFDRRVALMAAAFAAVHPALVSYTGQLMTETLSTLLLVALTYGLVRAVERPGARRWWIFSGALAGGSILARQDLLPVVACCAGALAWARMPARRIGLFLGAVALTMLPWTLRNYRTYGQIVLVSPVLGEGLWISTTDWLEWHSDEPRYRAIAEGLGPVQRDRAFQRAAVKNILDDPLGYLRRCVQRLPRFWIGGHSHTFVHLGQPLGSYIGQGAYLRAGIKLAMLLYNLSLMALGVLGLWLAWSLGAADRGVLVLLAAPIAAKAATHFFLFADLRYQVSMLPYLMVFAAFALRRSAWRPLTP